MKRTLVVAVAIFAVVLALSACTRSATGKIEFTPLPQATSFPTPVGLGAVPTATGAPHAKGQSLTAGEKSTLTPSSSKPTPKPKPKPKPTQTPTKAPTKAPTAVSVPSTYTLHKGEYPYCIARRFNVNPDALLAANHLVRGQIVMPGTALVIPKNAGPFPYQRAWHPHPTDYTVRYGDTIYSIACWFGDVTPEAIAAANNISVNSPLTPGQVLHIP